MTINKIHHETDSQNIVLYSSKGKLLLQCAPWLVFIFIGIGIIHIGYHPWTVSVGIPSVIFGSLGLIIVLYFLLAPMPILVINDEGIHCPLMRVTKTVKWEEIGAIYPRKVGTDILFEVTLSAEGMQTFRSRQSGSVRSSRFPRQSSRVILIPQRLLPLSVKQLIEGIQQRYQIYIEKYTIVIRM
jgi:hypothetical protein